VSTWIPSVANATAKPSKRTVHRSDHGAMNKAKVLTESARTTVTRSGSCLSQTRSVSIARNRPAGIDNARIRRLATAEYERPLYEMLKPTARQVESQCGDRLCSSTAEAAAARSTGQPRVPCCLFPALDSQRGRHRRNLFGQRQPDDCDAVAIALGRHGKLVGPMATRSEKRTLCLPAERGLLGGRTAPSSRGGGPDMRRGHVLATGSQVENGFCPAINRVR
jgi:hypothetical protein